MKISNIVKLINSYDKKFVTELSTKYPEQSGYLEKLDKYGGERSEIEFEIEASIGALVLMQERIAPNLEKLRERLANAKKLRLIASIITAVTGAGLIPLILKDKETLAVIVAIINFASSLLIILAKDVETSKISESSKLIDVFETLIKLLTESKTLEKKLTVKLNSQTFDDDTRSLIADADKLAGKLYELELVLGLVKSKY
jgi:hypothetical protein